MPKKKLQFAFVCLAVLKTATFTAAAAQANDNAASAAVAGSLVNPVIEWNRTLLTILRTPGAQPATIHATRSFAMLHAAVFDAVNAIDKTYVPYAVRLPHVSRTASTWAAADQAAHDVLMSLYPAFSSTLDAELQKDLDQLPDDNRKAEGIAVGEAVATATVALRQDDGSSTTLPPFVPTNQPGSYQLTPPNFAPADFIQWPRLPLSGKTAPDPSYPGAHSAISTAASWVLRNYLGDRISLDVTSESLPGVTRHFNSFSDAAVEAGLSRIYAGQHFRFDHEAGEQLGNRVAHAIMASTLKPR